MGAWAGLATPKSKTEPSVVSRSRRNGVDCASIRARTLCPVCEGLGVSACRRRPFSLGGVCAAWRERTPYGRDGDFVFPSFRLKGKKPLSASIMVQKYLRPAAIKAGVLEEGQRVHFGFHNFRHSLASALVKLKCDPKTVQSILRHEDVRTTMQLYVQSDQESKLEAQGKFLELLLGDKAHLLTEKVQ